MQQLYVTVSRKKNPGKAHDIEIKNNSIWFSWVSAHEYKNTTQIESLSAL